jgi:GMP synthase-like glutamine amidotransferase
LLKRVRKFSLCTIIPFNAIGEGYKIGAEIDVVVISGSSARIVNPDDRIRFEGVIELIKACNLPIFGICFGHQLLCLSLGAKVGALPQSVDNCFQKIRVVQIGDIFAGFREGQTIPLAEYHTGLRLKRTP